LFSSVFTFGRVPEEPVVLLATVGGWEDIY
jgi:hypothetical protein